MRCGPAVRLRSFFPVSSEVLRLLHSPIVSSMLDQLPPELQLLCLEHLGNPDAFFLRFLCKAVLSTATSFFVASIASLAKQRNVSAFVETVHQIRVRAPKVTGGPCLNPASVGFLLKGPCGLPVDSIFVMLVAKKLEKEPRDRGQLLQSAGISRGTLCNILSASSWLAKWEDPDAAFRFLEATGLNEKDLVGAVLDNSDEITDLAYHFAIIAHIQRWFDETWQPEKVNGGAALDAGIRLFYECVSERIHFHSDRANTIAGLAKWLGNGARPTLFYHIPKEWGWRFRGLVAVNFSLREFEEDDWEAETLVEDVVRFIRRIFLDSSCCAEATLADLRVFLSAVDDDLSALDEDGLDLWEPFFFDDLWPVNGALQLADFMGSNFIPSMSPDGLSGTLLNLLRSDRPVDLHRVAAFFGNLPIAEYVYREAFADRTPVDLVRLQNLLIATDTLISFSCLGKIVLARCIPEEGDGAWNFFPWITVSRPDGFSGSDIGNLVASVAITWGRDGCIASTFSKLVDDIITLMRIPLQRRFAAYVNDGVASISLPGGALKFKQDVVGSMAVSFYRDIESAGVGNPSFPPMVFLGALFSPVEATMHLELKALLATQHRVTELFQTPCDIRDFLVGHAWGSGLEVGETLAASNWTMDFPALGFPPCMAVENTCLRDLALYSPLSQDNRRQIFGSFGPGVIDRISLVSNWSNQILQSIASRGFSGMQVRHPCVDSIMEKCGCNRNVAYAALAVNGWDWNAACESVLIASDSQEDHVLAPLA